MIDYVKDFKHNLNFGPRDFKASLTLLNFQKYNIKKSKNGEIHKKNLQYDCFFKKFHHTCTKPIS